MKAERIYIYTGERCLLLLTLCYCVPRLTLLIAQEQAVLLAAWFQVRTSMIIIIMALFFHKSLW